MKKIISIFAIYYPLPLHLTVIETEIHWWYVIVDF